MRCVLTIAGSDCSGGAGIQADLKTFCAFGVYGLSVVTALTAQNTTGVQGIMKVGGEFVVKQLDSVLSDLKIDAVKIGMLNEKDVVSIVTEKLLQYGQKNIVYDPVMYAKSGAVLLKRDARDVIKEKLIPICDVLTPNISEAEALSGISIGSVDDMKNASEKIYFLGCKAVIIKGGHLSGDAVDVLFDGKEFTLLRSARISKRNPHGTGCTFSSAIASGLALGSSLTESFKNAKEYINNAIEKSLSMGSGFDLINHLYRIFI